MQPNNEASTYPSAGEVLRALADTCDEEGTEGFDRITVEQATPTQYACRIYPARGEEYEGHFIRLGEDPPPGPTSEAVTPTLRDGV